MLLELVSRPDGDAAGILHQFGQDRVRLVGRLEKAISGLRTGNGGKPTFSASLFQWMEDAWTVSSLETDATRLRTGALLLQFIANPGRSTAPRRCRSWRSIPRDQLKQGARRHRRGLQGVRRGQASQAPRARPRAPAAGLPRWRGAWRQGTSENLARFCENLTQKARDGKIDPVFGRHTEIRQLVDILSRRRKNNPIIVGEAGTGKTALVEGLAIEIIQGLVPDHLKNVELLSLDIGALQAGAGVKGEFENRLKNVINEVKASAKPIILFIDEAHTIIGAGGAAGRQRRGQPAQARAGPRRAAHHRGHHVV
jgi:type VI secretion system protein VasG